MNYRRNLGVAAVTAAVVTTALVGTTLPDLMSDRTANSTQDKEAAADSVVVTDIPDVPSAKEISHAKESSEATDDMISDINERLSQANQRALELEAAQQMEQQEALEAQQAAEEAAREAEEAQQAADSQAAEDYQEGETSAEDVLLDEDEDALADSATDDQLAAQAEEEADAAEQDADEAAQLEENAADLQTMAEQSSQDSEESEEQAAADFEELGESVRDLLAAAAELEGYEDLRTYYALVLGNPDLVDENGEVDTEALGWHIATLRDDAQTASSDDEEDETAEDSAEDEEGEASSSAESEATDEDEEEDAEQDQAQAGHSLSQYLPGTRALVAELAELSDESTEETFQRLIADSDFTTDSGLLDHSAINAEVNRLAPEPEPEESEDSGSSEESSGSDESEESGAEESQGSGHSLDQYQSGTRGLVERIAELSDESAEETFERLIADSDFTTSEGHLNHSALQREVNRLAPAPEPEEESSSEEESEGSGGSGSGSSDSGSSTPSHSLSQYQSGTRGLVEQIAELNGDGVEETFERLVSDSDFTDSSGILDHGALQQEVNRLSPSEESSGSGSSGGSSSGGSNNQSSGGSSGGQQTGASGGGGSGAAQIAADWAASTVQRSDVHYVLGGNGPNAWDCSSLTQQAMAQAGVSIPRTSQAQFNGGQAVSLDNLQVGDLVFWGGDSSIHHVAIYIGNGQIAHARNPSAGLSITSVYYSYDAPNPTAKRYF